MCNIWHSISLQVQWSFNEHPVFSLTRIGIPYYFFSSQIVIHNQMAILNSISILHDTKKVSAPSPTIIFPIFVMKHISLLYLLRLFTINDEKWQNLNFIFNKISDITQTFISPWELSSDDDWINIQLKRHIKLHIPPVLEFKSFL